MRHLNAGTVLAAIALFVSLGGGAYAAIKLPKNSVTTKQVKDRSLLARDFKSGQLPAGAQGPAGPQGAPGIAGVVRIDGPATTLCGNGGGACQDASSTATCPAGSVVVGGGSKVTSIDVRVTSARADSDTSYTVAATSRSSTEQTVQAQAICAQLAH